MASSSESEDDAFMAIDGEDAIDGTMEQDDEPRARPEPDLTRHDRSMSELPEEVLEYILSFLSPYQEHKTAALVCKQWYRLIKADRLPEEYIALEIQYVEPFDLTPCHRILVKLHTSVEL